MLTSVIDIDFIEPRVSIWIEFGLFV